MVSQLEYPNTVRKYLNELVKRFFGKPSVIGQVIIQNTRPDGTVYLVGDIHKLAPEIVCIQVGVASWQIKECFQVRDNMMVIFKESNFPIPVIGTELLVVKVS